jgi:HEAT repeat protein
VARDQGGVDIAAERDVIVSGKIIGRDYIEYRYSDKEELEHFMDQAILGYNIYARQLRKSLKSSAPANNPYLFLESFSINHHSIFFGRDQVSEELYQHVIGNPLTVLHARSGAGKSSLLNAGLGPRLVIDRGILPIFARTYNDPISEIVNQVAKHATTKVRPKLLDKVPLHNALQMIADRMSEDKLVVILDQFEEIFTQTLPDIRKAMIASIGNCLKDETLPVHFVFAIRREYLGDLEDFPAHLPQALHHTYPLRSMEPEELKSAITGPLQELNKGIEYEDALLTELIQILSQVGMDLTTLQVICTRLYEAAEAADSTTIDMKLYEDLGRYDRILATYVDDALEAFPTPTEQELAKQVLMALVDSQGHRSLATQEEISRIIPRGIEHTPDDIKKAIGGLVARRLLHTTEEKQQFELAHDHLGVQVVRWIDSADVPRRQAKELVENGLLGYQLGEILLDRRALELVNGYRDTIEWSPQEVAFICHSAQMHRVGSAFWLEKLTRLKVELRDNGDIKPFIVALTNRDESTGQKAYEALAQMGDAAVDLLIATLKDEESGIRGSVASVLGRIGGSRAVEPLIAALQDEESDIRGSVASVLGEIGDSRTVKPLIAALQDEDGDVRGSATSALVKIGHAAVRQLIAALQDEDSDVRWSAAYALGQIGDSRAVKSLKVALNYEKDRHVRTLIHWALERRI